MFSQYIMGNVASSSNVWSFTLTRDKSKLGYLGLCTFNFGYFFLKSVSYESTN